MKEVSTKQLYLSEFQFHDGIRQITFNIVDIDTKKKEITVAITNEGRISVQCFDLKSNNGLLYFEYGVMLDEICVDDFKHVDDTEN
jgi:hypothetical protein